MRPKMKKMSFSEMENAFQMVDKQEQAFYIGGNSPYSFQNNCYWIWAAEVNFANMGGCVETWCPAERDRAALGLAKAYYGFDPREVEGGYGGAQLYDGIYNSVLDYGAVGVGLSFNPSQVNIEWYGGGVTGAHQEGWPDYHVVHILYDDKANGKVYIWCSYNRQQGRVCRNELLNSSHAFLNHPGSGYGYEYEP